MSLRKRVNKSIAIALVGITAVIPMMNSVSAVENNNIEYLQNDRNDEENKNIIIEKGGVLTDDDFSEIYIIYEENLRKGIEMKDEDIRELLVEKIINKVNSPVTYGYSIFGRNITKEELILVAKYPSDATKVFNNSKTASSEAERLYVKSTLYLGNGDAFRHAYWNALNVKSVGVTKARDFANAHESETKDGNDKTMDLRNNVLGRNIAKSNINSSISTIKNKIISDINKGRMHRLYNGKIEGKLISTDSSGRR